MLIDESQEIGVYIHWPFCISKCKYCNFNSYVKNVQDGFFEIYLKNLQKFSEYFKDKKLSTIYFGGGTPSLMKSDHIEEVINIVQKSVEKVDESIEITLEANPETIDEKILIDFKKVGINRISLGIQSYVDNWLELMGRKNNRIKNIQTIEIVDNVFENYSVDLIYSLPYQNNWSEELQEALVLSKNAKHFSLYELSLEKGTFFDANYKNADYKDYIDITREIMIDHGFDHYEISSYAKSGYYSRHNMIYWNYKDYVGIGAGAHGRISVDNFKYAFNGDNDLKKWMDQELNFRKLTKMEMEIEKILMGFRTNIWQGINYEIINREKLENYIALGFFETNIKNEIRTTFEGKKRLNILTEEIIKDEIF